MIEVATIKNCTLYFLNPKDFSVIKKNGEYVIFRCHGTDHPDRFYALGRTEKRLVRILCAEINGYRLGTSEIIRDDYREGIFVRTLYIKKKIPYESWMNIRELQAHG